MPMPNSRSLRSAFTLISLWFCCQLSIAGPGVLNDTGITFCGDDSSNTANCATLGSDGGRYPRQDATKGRDASASARQLVKVGGGSAGFDFTKIANNGGVLPATAVLGGGSTDWACTRDNLTGLTWEIKTTSGLRSLSHTYTWYNSDNASNGGSVGTFSDGTCYQSGRCDTEKFVQDVNAAGLCGSSAWRMPTVKELEGIADLGRTNPAIDPTYFPNTSRSFFWSGSPYAGSSFNAWVVSFLRGDAVNKFRDSGYLVRLVRGGE